MSIGIDGISVHVPDRFLELADLAAARGVPAAKFRDGLGQERMAVAPPDEDVVTMAAAAAAPLLDGIDLNSIDTLIMGTEGGVDESKASAIYVHRLLGLPKSVKAFEVKQACCGATCGLGMALNLVARYPHRRALVIGSDIARYEPGSPGEPTQGAGAVAMLVGSQPRILALDAEWGTYTDDVMDFWRPSYRRDAVVDGKYSIKVYLRALEEAWDRYSELNSLRFEDHARLCFHLPFTRMAEKACSHLLRVAGGAGADEAGLIADGLRYNRVVGNSYTASLFMALASLLDRGGDELAEKRVGLFSYGSGCMAAFFSGVLQEGFQRALRSADHAAMFARREAVSIADYTAWQQHELPEDGSELVLPCVSRNRFRLAAVRGHQRIYEAGALRELAA